MRSFLPRPPPLSAAAHMIHTPILVVQGQNYLCVPISEAEQMVPAVLEENGVPLWYLVSGTNEGHGLLKQGQPGLSPGDRGDVPEALLAG